MKAGKWFGIASVTGVSHIISAIESHTHSDRNLLEFESPLPTPSTRQQARDLKLRSPWNTKRESNIVEVTTEAPREDDDHQRELYEQPNHHEPYSHGHGYSYYPHYHSPPLSYVQTVYLKDDNSFGFWKLVLIVLVVPIALFIVLALGVSFANVAARAGIQQQQQQSSSNNNNNANSNNNANGNALVLYVNATGRSFDVPSSLSKSPKRLSNSLL